MSRPRPRTINGHDLSEVVSSLQKSIRRGDAKLAGYFALEMYHSNFWRYLWKRLYTISAEDCDGFITKEVHALFNGFILVNDKTAMNRGRIFISKCVILLATSFKNRDPDHLQNLIYDANKISDDEIDKYLYEVREAGVQPIPDYAFDCHTFKGRRNGKTKHDFFIDEFIDMKPKQVGLFDELIDEMQNQNGAWND